MKFRSEKVSTTMPMNEYQYSPFFSVRKILFLLRCTFGFPLNPKNGAYNDFVFNSWLEYSRYILYICIAFTSYICVIFLHLKNSNIETPIRFMRHNSRILGISLLDVFIINTIPFTNLISTMFHMRSFKKCAKNLNKICKGLTQINSALCTRQRETLFVSYSHNWCKKSIVFVSIGVVLSTISLLLILSQWMTTFTILVKENLMSQEDLVPFCIATTIWTLCWIYPCISISADFITCHLLGEIADCFEAWKLLLRFKERKARDIVEQSCIEELERNENKQHSFEM